MNRTQTLSALAICAGMTMAAPAQATLYVSDAYMGTWASTVQARDINHDGTIEGFYDSSLNITWARMFTEGNYFMGRLSVPVAAGQFNDANGTPLFSTEISTGWRLPVSKTLSTGLPANVTDKTNEWAYTYYVTLGNKLNGTVNTGFLSNDVNQGKWTGLPLFYGDTPQTRSAPAHYFSLETGTMGVGSSLGTIGQEWFVHDGDVFGPQAAVVTAAVPEPSSWLLSLVGLSITGLMFKTSRRRH